MAWTFDVCSVYFKTISYVAWATLTNGLLTSASQAQELPACV